MTGRPLVTLLAHGSVDPRHAVDVQALARRLALLTGAQTAAAYLERSEPDLEAVAREADRALVVVPLLLAAGYHAKVDVPGVAQRASAHVPALRVTRPPVMAGATWARAAVEQLAGPADPRRRLVVATAGSSRVSVRTAWDEAATRWQAEWGWGDVVVGHVSGPGRALGDVLAAPRPSTVVPALVARGWFGDLVARQAGAAGARITPPVGHAAAFVAALATAAGLGRATAGSEVRAVSRPAPRAASPAGRSG